MYGYPGDGMMESAQKKEIILGGCIIYPKNPNKQCLNCGHQWKSKWRDIKYKNNWCPFCYNRKLCSNCVTCYNKSFASHPKSIYLSIENKLNARQLFLNSNKKYKFVCDKCNHSFDITLNKIASLSKHSLTSFNLINLLTFMPVACQSFTYLMYLFALPFISFSK